MVEREEGGLTTSDPPDSPSGDPGSGSGGSTEQRLRRVEAAAAEAAVGAPFNGSRAPERATVYWVVLLLLLGGSILLTRSPWRTGETLHTVTEAIATVLAFVVGALALVRFYSRKQGTFLFIGTGFLGTGLLDGYHALVSAGVLAFDPEVTRVTDLTAWSWTASRLFLALFLFVSLLAWRQESRTGRGAVREDSVYVTAGILTVVIAIFFSIAPLAAAYHPDLFFSRPGEFLPAIFFGATLVGYVRKGRWRRDAFEHWLVVSLLIAVLAHAGYMSRSAVVHDAWYDAAHALKLASYVAILTGLLISVFVTFRREEEALEAIQEANEAMAHEVAVRREAERVLQESEERLQNFLDNAHDLVQSTDPSGRILYVNRAWAETLGYDETEAGDLTLWDLLESDVVDEVRSAYQALLEGGHPGRILLQIRTRGGERVICSGSATVHRVDGEPVAVQGIFRDVTEQRRAERELAASRANLEAIFENTGDAIWSVDPDHRLITFNSAFALGVEASTGDEPTRGDPPEVVFGPDQGEWYREIYDRALRGERFSEQLSEEVDGQGRAIEIYCNPITDEKGVTGAVMFGKDITRRKRAEDALVMAKEEAEAANRAKSQFLASMSHELRTPLNSVIGFANILIKNKKDHLDEKELGFLDRILANGRHLLELINEVLDLAKIEAGRMELEILETDLSDLVEETVAQLEGRVTERPVDLIAETPDALPPVETDPSKLKQVIINLVGNALKFTEEGSVTVRLETDDRGGRPTAIHVIDTGIGIPDDRLDAIFEAFQQADGSTSRKYGGTGLGLAISRSICQLLGYDLTVTSEVGVGSCFTILMAGGDRTPDGRQDAAEDAGTGDDVASGNGAGGARALAAISPSGDDAEDGEEELETPDRDFRVLVIDDEADSRVLMRHYLEDFGCEVITSPSADQGIELARKHSPDLITLDLMMPGMTGWEALEAMKGDPSLRGIPVVVVSIVAGEGGRGKLLGAVDLLTKPVEREDLLRVLWRNLVRRRGGRVLVVEDDPDIRRILEEYLVEAGLEVEAVENGKEALVAVEREAPDAVLLDLMMPVMDGMTFLNELRESPYHSGLPVIVLTAKDLSLDERAELDEKASGVIHKGDSVEERLREVLGALFPISDAPG